MIHFGKVITSTGSQKVLTKDRCIRSWTLTLSSSKLHHNHSATNGATTKPFDRLQENSLDCLRPFKRDCGSHIPLHSALLGIADRPFPQCRRQGASFTRGRRRPEGVIDYDLVLLIVTIFLIKV